MQEALHRLDAKVSHIYHHCNDLVEKADTIGMNQITHMKMSTSVTTAAATLPASPAPTMPSTVTPEPPKKKARLVTLFYSPAPIGGSSVPVSVYNSYTCLY